MAKIPVKQQKVFGGSINPSGQIAQFGSLAAGAPTFSGDPVIIQGLPAWVNGWASALINAPGGLASPALEDFNGILFVLTYQLAYLKQAGLLEWDPTVPYFIGSWARDVAGTAYRSKTDNNQNNALTDTNHWELLSTTLIQSSPAAARAWVNFNGVTMVVNAGYNVASVVKNATGIYTINFITPMANANYAWAGSCGTPNGVSAVPGDNNVLVGATTSGFRIKSTTQLQIYAREPQGQATEDSQDICVQIFGT